MKRTSFSPPLASFHASVFEAARHYDDAEWDSVSAGLVGRGLLDRDGNLTAQGKA